MNHQVAVQVKRTIKPLVALTMQTTGCLLFALFFCLYMQPLFAEPSAAWQPRDFPLLTQNTPQDNTRQDKTAEPLPPSGTLVLPDSRDDTDVSEKRCMTVCAQWGEECSYINRGSAGTTRSCRRTCQQYKEECF